MAWSTFWVHISEQFLGRLKQGNVTYIWPSLQGSLIHVFLVYYGRPITKEKFDALTISIYHQISEDTLIRSM